jgi:hypothetical protein
MNLWIEWWKVVSQLRPACSRTRTFLWLLSALAGISVRSDLLGVSSIVRSLGLIGKSYDHLLDFFHSDGIEPNRLSKLWTQIALRIFPTAMRLNGRLVLLGDGIKVPKAGRKMPAVKTLHQESDSNTKPEYIMGHSCQAVSLVVGAEDSAFAVPLATRIHEGVVFSNRDETTLITKMVSLIELLGLAEPFYFVADAYYASRVIALELLAAGAHLVTRVRSNAVAYWPATQPKSRRRKRGRPKMYGKKVKLFSLFDDARSMVSVASPVYGEVDVTIKYRVIDLFWKPLKRLVRFVLVDHPTRGKTIFMTTDIHLDPTEVIRLYGIRYKIELSFKQALRVVGAFAYHFWMKSMKPIERFSGDQYMHHESARYRDAVRRKILAYHRYIQIGLIAQGLLQYLSVQFPELVWENFGSWLRTIRPGIPPSELVVAQALRASLPEFLARKNPAAAFTKFILERTDLSRSEGLRLAGSVKMGYSRVPKFIPQNGHDFPASQILQIFRIQIQ